MYSLIDIRDTRAMTAEQKLMEIEKPIENLQLTLSLLTKMQQDIALEAEEVSAMFISLHKQVIDIQRAIQ